MLSHTYCMFVAARPCANAGVQISDISVSILIKAIILFFNIFLLTKITGSLGVGGSGGGE